MKVNKANEFYKILERKAIYPVFQPIVNLQTGRVSGYEALSRIDRSSTTLTISDLFVIAEQDLLFSTLVSSRAMPFS